MLSIMVPGPLATLQDGGALGHQSTGFPQTGAADTDSRRKANLLVGNPQYEACIEMTLMGITAYFTKDTVIALTGADVAPQLNWEPIPMYKAIAVKKGDTLTGTYAKTGCRAYLAIAGGFDIPQFLGSKSTNLKLRSGGFEGRKLRAGDLIPYEKFTINQSELAKKQLPPTEYKTEVTLRTVLGPQADAFTSSAIQDFLTSKYLVTESSDRMGLRLSGKAIQTNNGSDIISDGIALGSIQIPPNGQPILLGPDRQTTGGYAKIATVISTDMPLAAQLKPGDAIRFTSVDIRQAQKLYIANEKHFRTLAKRFK